MKGGKYILSKIPGRLLVYLYALFLLVPMYFIVITSLKPGPEVSSNPIGLPSRFAFENYKNAFIESEMLRLSVNSIIITVTAVAWALLNAIILSYGIYKLYNKKIGTLIYGIIIVSMFIPNAGLVAMIQLYMKLGIYNTLWGPILSGAFGGIAFNVFILLGFVRSLPRDLEDAAIIDGCNDFQHLFYIIVPLTKTALTTLAIFAFVSNWNNLMTPLVLLKNKELYTIPLGIFNFRGTYSVQYHLIFAVIIIATTPLIILYLKFQDNFVEALAGSIKG